jgi:hypothetical protein
MIPTNLNSSLLVESTKKVQEWLENKNFRGLKGLN